MFTQEWVEKRIKTIINYYGHDFFNGKKILDIGSGNGVVARAFADLGAKVTCCDVRKHKLDAIYNSNPFIRCVKADLDQEWPFSNDFFDLTLHLSTLDHLMYIEKHLQFICRTTNYLVLDCQVCDSNDPSKYFLIKENKSNAEHSFNGVGCRASPAFIERILSNSGMEFKKLDTDSCNVGRISYDWVGKNSNSIQQGLCRMWFCQRNALKKIINNTIQPEPPKSPALERIFPIIEIPSVQEKIENNLLENNLLDNNFNLTQPKLTNVRDLSKEFALHYKESWQPPVTFDTSGIILPLTVSSKMWLKKIEPFFPNLRIHHLAHTMRGFNKSRAQPNLVMCSINNIYQSKRIWLEEWFERDITDEEADKLKNCEVIFTPSILNKLAILRKLPQANVKRISKIWPSLNKEIEEEKNNNFIYFEKDIDFTKNLISIWKPEFGKLLVVGGSVNTPRQYIDWLSDCEDYSVLYSSLQNSKCLIDLTINEHYDSAILSLAKEIGIPVITNNQYSLDDDIFLLQADKKISKNFSSNDLEKILEKFKNYSSIKKEIKLNYNLKLKQTIEEMLGLNA